MRKLLVPAVLALAMLVVVAPANAAPKQTFTFKQGSYSVTEGNTTNPIVQILVTRNYTKNHAQVQFSADTGTATGDTGSGCSGPPVDFVKRSDVVVDFPVGTAQVPVTVRTCGDNVYEGNEYVTLRLYNPDSGYSIANKSSEPLNINDNDPVPSISIDNPSYAEGSLMYFTLQLSNPAQSGVSVHYGTSDGSATSPEDYDTGSGTVSWAKYDNSLMFVSVQTNDDSKYGLGESFHMDLTNAVGGTIATPSGTGNITETDAKPNVWVSDAHNWEGSPITFMVRQDAVSEAPTMVDLSTIDGTGDAGTCGAPGDNDYAGVAPPTTVTIPAGSTSVPFDVTTCQDSTPEDNETFTAHAQNPVNGNLVAFPDATGTIKDDDPASLTFDSVGNFTNGQFDSKWFVTNTNGDALNGVLVRFEDYHTTGFGFPYFDGVDLTGPGKAAFDYTGDNVATTGGSTAGDEGDGIATLRAPVEPTGQYAVGVACVTTTFDPTESACGAVTDLIGTPYDGDFSLQWPGSFAAPNPTTNVQLFSF